MKMTNSFNFLLILPLLNSIPQNKNI